MKKISIFVIMYFFSFPIFSISLNSFFSSCDYGDIETVTQGLNEGISINEIDEKGFSALCYAARDGNDELLEFLISRGANVNLAVKHPPLHLASNNNHRSSVKLLIDGGVNLYQLDEYGYTAFETALEEGYYDVCDLFIEFGYNLSFENSEKVCALIKFVQAKNIPLETVVYLLENGANVNARENDGSTALINSIYHRNFELTKFLIDSGANVNVVNKDGESALLKACCFDSRDPENDYRIVEYLLDCGADPTVVDSEGNSCVYLAVLKDYPVSVINRLISKGGPINQETKNKSSAFTTAVSKGNIDIISLLLQYETDINIKDSNGLNALYKLYNNPLNVAKLLIEHGIDVNAQDNEGNTVLYKLCFSENVELIRTLLEGGVNPNIYSASSSSPLEISVWKFNTMKETAEILNKEIDNDDFISLREQVKLLLEFNAKPTSAVWNQLNKTEDQELHDIFINYFLNRENLSYRKACTGGYTTSDIFQTTIEVTNVKKIQEIYPKRNRYEVSAKTDDKNSINIVFYDKIDFIVNDLVDCYLRFTGCDENQTPCFELMRTISVK